MTELTITRYGEHNPTATLAVAQGLDPAECEGGIYAAEYGDRIVRAGCPLEAASLVMEWVTTAHREQDDNHTESE